jgi:ribosome-binding protein aMBF1 (putative translation factor)
MPRPCLRNGAKRSDGYSSPWTDSQSFRILTAVEKKSPYLAELGRRIRDTRTSAGMTQEDLAHESEIDRSYIGGVERGERNVTFVVLCRIAGALRCDVAALTKGLPPRA